MGKKGEKIGLFSNEKGQVTLFIIIAVVIVGMGVLIYVFYPQISSVLGVSEQDANAFIQNCIEDEIGSKVLTVSSQGGFLEPAPYVLYQNEKIQYLCYTEGYYKTCSVQKPLLENQIEREIKEGIEDDVKTCFNGLKSSFEDRDYEVIMREGNIDVQLMPGKIVSTFNYTVTLTKTETQRYESFNVMVNNNIYELINIANNIIDWESTYGDADASLYMDLNHNLKVEKRKPEYGATVYILTDKTTGDKFQFAARSLVVPPGYGYNVV